MTKASSESAADLAGKLRAGDRRALARAITLIESTKPDHTGEAEALLEALLPFSGASVRIGISGVPGVGKSTRSEEHTSELQSLMRISYAVFCLKKQKKTTTTNRKRKHIHNPRIDIKQH